MTNNFDEITATFRKAGLDVRTAEYSITEYSLNTELSFRFENYDDLIGFLDHNGGASDNAKENINAMLVKESIDPDKYFYVNFYKPKVAEL